MGHVPSGMELFSAADEEQFSYIKRIIDESDYYILVIGGRYGSTDHQGVSYTEKEYDHAYSKRIPVLAFLHEDINKIPYGNVDSAEEKMKKLQLFQKKVSERRMVNFWTDKDALQAKVIVSLTKAFADTPRTGWVRGDTVASEELLGEINKFRNIADELQSENLDLKQKLTPMITNLAPLSETCEVNYRYHYQYNVKDRTKRYDDKISFSWENLWTMIGPTLFAPQSVDMMERTILSRLNQRKTDRRIDVIFRTDLDKIKIQFMSHGFIAIYSAQSVQGNVHEYIVITELGKGVLAEVMAIRRDGNLDTAEVP
jgi:hypothetical protein